MHFFGRSDGAGGFSRRAGGSVTASMAMSGFSARATLWRLSSKLEERSWSGAIVSALAAMISTGSCAGSPPRLASHPPIY